MLSGLKNGCGQFAEYKNILSLPDAAMTRLRREVRVAGVRVSGCGSALSSRNEMHIHCQLHSTPTFLSGQTILQSASKGTRIVQADSGSNSDSERRH